MSDLPRRPIEPLAPPAGSFDAVVGRARYRRQRRVGTAMGVAVVFFVGLAGGASLEGGVSRVSDTIVALAGVDQEVPSTQEPNTSAVVTPEVDETQQPQDARDGGAGAETGDRAGDGVGDVAGGSMAAIAAPAAATVNGVAADAAGGPIAGLYVYPGQRGHDRFLATDEPATRTAKDGSFSVPCTGTPVLLSPWPVNAPAGAAGAAAVWAATFVGGGTEAAGAADAPCTTDGAVVTTTLLPGSTVAGTVTIPTECADQQLPLWVWLHNDRTLTVRLPDRSSGSSYSLGGLPAGQHTLGANGNRTTVTVGGTTTWTKDVTFGCGPGSPPQTPEPSTSTSQTTPPAPSDTATPVPTTTSSEPEPDPTSSPTPTPTPTGNVVTRP